MEESSYSTAAMSAMLDSLLEGSLPSTSRISMVLLCHQVTADSGKLVLTRFCITHIHVVVAITWTRLAICANKLSVQYCTVQLLVMILIMDSVCCASAHNCCCCIVNSTILLKGIVHVINFIILLKVTVHEI